MIRLTLYGTSACHLCDAAMAELAPLKAKGIEVQEVDIADADQLMTLYQLRIPVLRRADTGAAAACVVCRSWKMKTSRRHFITPALPANC